MLHHFAQGRAATDGRAAAGGTGHFVARVVDVVADGRDLLFSVEVASDDVVGFDKGVELSLKVLVLLS